MWYPFSMFTITAYVVMTSTCLGASYSDLDEPTFRKLHKQLQPSLTEPWRSIPWKISLLDAQREAARVKKPLFIWAMDGHPLGCT